MAAGMAIVSSRPGMWHPFGFALVAIGAADPISVMIGVAARAPGTTPSAGVAATAALLGFLIGPPIIGFIAQRPGSVPPWRSSACRRSSSPRARLYSSLAPSSQTVRCSKRDCPAPGFA